MTEIDISKAEKCAMSLLLSLLLIAIALVIISLGVPLSTLQSIASCMNDPIARLACIAVFITVFALSYAWVTVTEDIVRRFDQEGC
jgi:type VI protein secretion system component VasK